MDFQILFSLSVFPIVLFMEELSGIIAVMKKNKTILWSLVAILISGLTIYAVFSNSRQLSFADIKEALRSSSRLWLAMAFLCVLSFIVFEMLAILWVLKHLGYKRSIHQGLMYSAGDIYFSAITPSASGGQPVSAFFMHQDTIPSAVISVTLVINLIMYTLAILVIGIFCITLGFKTFLLFNHFSHFLIIFGMAALTVLALFFYTVLRRSEILHRFGIAAIELLSKLHVLKNEKGWKDRLERVIREYSVYAKALSGKRRMLVVLFLLNLLQRISQITVTPMIYFAIHGKRAKNGMLLWIIQAFSQIGSNCVPIPGGVGVADYLMLDGFNTLFVGDYANKLEILSRGMSFYICTLTSGIIILIGALWRRRRSNGKEATGVL